MGDVPRSEAGPRPAVPAAAFRCSAALRGSLQPGSAAAFSEEPLRTAPQAAAPPPAAARRAKKQPRRGGGAPRCRGAEGGPGRAGPGTCGAARRGSAARRSGPRSACPQVGTRRGRARERGRAQLARERRGSPGRGREPRVPSPCGPFRRLQPGPRTVRGRSARGLHPESQGECRRGCPRAFRAGRPARGRSSPGCGVLHRKTSETRHKVHERKVSEQD